MAWIDVYLGRVKRCGVHVGQTGAGHQGPHRCTFQAKVKWLGVWMCWTHFRWARRQVFGER